MGCSTQKGTGSQRLAPASTWFSQGPELLDGGGVVLVLRRRVPQDHLLQAVDVAHGGLVPQHVGGGVQTVALQLAEGHLVVLHWGQEENGGKRCRQHLQTPDLITPPNIEPPLEART